jgi:hypothetical protein
MAIVLFTDTWKKDDAYSLQDKHVDELAKQILFIEQTIFTSDNDINFNFNFINFSKIDKIIKKVHKEIL